MCMEQGLYLMSCDYFQQKKNIGQILYNLIAFNTYFTQLRALYFFSWGQLLLQNMTSSLSLIRDKL